MDALLFDIIDPLPIFLDKHDFWSIPSKPCGLLNTPFDAFDYKSCFRKATVGNKFEFVKKFMPEIVNIKIVKILIIKAALKYIYP